MANTLITKTEVTRKALMLLHQKLNFIGNINRQYDDRFAQKGAKIGDTLDIRLPNEYVIRTGATLSTQDTTESTVQLQVNNHAGVDLNFTSADLTLDMDDFSERILDPAMAVVAAKMESDALSMYKDVYNQVDNIGSTATFRSLMLGSKELTDNLSPYDKRCITLNTTDNVDLVDSLKGLFNDQKNISKQYRDGMLGRTAGFKFFENTLLANHLTGTAAATTGYLVNGAAQSGAAITVDTGTTTFLKGDIITFAGVNRVHPETKVSTGVLQKFAITADSGASATSLAITPSMTLTGGRQNVTGAPADNAAIVKQGGASASHGISLGFHKNAFAFATADLVMPEGVDFASRQVYDGISIRIVRAFDINNDKFPCRLDVMYGYKTIRAKTAVRFANN